MSQISTVLPTVPTSGTASHLSAGLSGGATALHNGGRTDPVAEPYTARPVQPASGLAEAVGYYAEDSARIEAARDQAEAAQRAYIVATLMEGRNPLIDMAP